MENINIERTGIPNLDFVGELIGQSGGPNPQIKIYRTQGQKYIGQTDAGQKFSKAEHFDKPANMIIWFRSTCGLGSVVEDAIEDAAKHDEAFKTAWNEHVD